MVRDDIRRYYESKIRCPECGSKDIAETQINILDLPEGQYRDTRNQTSCNDCGWRGVVDKLKG